MSGTGEQHEESTAQTTTTTSTTATTTTTSEVQSSSTSSQQHRSALRHNIEQKGRNSYYFAHSNTPTGPVWDGKEQPRLLSRSSSCNPSDDSGVDSVENGTGNIQQTISSGFDYNKSNITSYSFLDDGPVVKLYLTGLNEIGDKCTTDDVIFDYTERSFSITINNFKTEPQILCFARLSGRIVGGSYKIKPNKIIITLTKADDDVKDWHTINDKGTPDHDVV